MKKMLEIMMTGIIALSLAACGELNTDRVMSTDQPSTAGSTKETTSAGTPQTKLASLFRNSVFLGDSITEGLSYHEVLAEENVLAGAGKTAEFAMGDMEDLIQRNPKQIFIQLGSDDILWPTEHPLDYAINHYISLIEAIKQKLPQAEITVLSVTPVSEETLGDEPRYRNIPAFNERLKEMAAKEQVGFVDLSVIIAIHPDLYDTDGIHFKPEFYPLMLEALKDQVE